MKAFLLSALPWVLAGLAVAILCANGSRKKANDSREGKRIALGMSLGLLLGVALDACGLRENHSIGLALGPLWAWLWPPCFPKKTALPPTKPITNCNIEILLYVLLSNQQQKREPTSQPAPFFYARIGSLRWAQKVRQKCVGEGFCPSLVL